MPHQRDLPTPSVTTSPGLCGAVILTARVDGRPVARCECQDADAARIVLPSLEAVAQFEAVRAAANAPPRLRKVG